MNLPTPTESGNYPYRATAIYVDGSDGDFALWARDMREATSLLLDLLPEHKVIIHLTVNLRMEDE
jgi:hypothetical protein